MGVLLASMSSMCAMLALMFASVAQALEWARLLTGACRSDGGALTGAHFLVGRTSGVPALVPGSVDSGGRSAVLESADNKHGARPIPNHPLGVQA